MTNFTPEDLQNYLKKLQRQYSRSSFNRKLSSLRRFVRFLQEKSKIDNKKAKELTDMLNLKSTPIAKLPAETLASERKLEARGKKRDTAAPAGEEKRKDKSKNEEIKRSHFREPMSVGPNSASHFSPRTSSITFILVVIFLFFSSNIYFLGKINSKILERIDAAVTTETQTPSSESIPNSAIIRPADITLTLTIDATIADNFDIPLSYEQDLNFAIYPTRSSNNPLYTTGLCQVEPDANGRISVELGKDCGQPISYSLFTLYPELYLGINIGFGSELQPRFALKKLDLLSGLSRPTSPPVRGEPSPTPVPLFVDEIMSTESGRLEPRNEKN